MIQRFFRNEFRSFEKLFNVSGFPKRRRFVCMVDIFVHQNINPFKVRANCGDHRPLWVFINAWSLTLRMRFALWWLPWQWPVHWPLIIPQFWKMSVSFNCVLWHLWTPTIETDSEFRFRRRVYGFVRFTHFNKNLTGLSITVHRQSTSSTIFASFVLASERSFVTKL